MRFLLKLCDSLREPAKLLPTKENDEFDVLDLVDNQFVHTLRPIAVRNLLRKVLAVMLTLVVA
jgi:hypothetical protein